MELKVKAPYEPLTIEIGNAVVETRINVTVDGLLDIGEACHKAHSKMTALQKLRDQAEQSKNVSQLRKLNKQTADVLEVAVKAGIGEEGYDAIVEACGAGYPISKVDCNIVMGKVFRAIFQTVKERQEDTLNEKAAHYLAEVDDAQSEPDPED